MQEAWPALPLEEWQATYATLHMYTQVVGKVAVALAPMTNEWWQAALHVTARGLTTGPLPYGLCTCQLDFDLLAHELVLRTSDGRLERVPLGLSVADFYQRVEATLHAWEMPVHLWTVPVEVAEPTPFEEDTRNTYDRHQVERCFQILSQVDVVLKRFRAGFRGKSSPVHFFWGSFDLAVTRFSGRCAPPRPQADRITRLAYDEEVISVGFWPGGDWPGAGRVDGPLFYAYAAPKPEGLEAAELLPEAARWDAKLAEFVLPYEAVRQAPDPVAAILEFAESSYDAAAHLAHWPVDRLAYRPGQPRITLLQDETARHPR